jgi:ribosome-associated toxin RatA of RatAB toxin-antitoxin module
MHLLDTLSHAKQQTLLNGKSVVYSTDNRYTGQILIPASHQQVWKVATDYPHFSQFLPSVESSTVLETEGDRTVLEQVAGLKVFMAKVQSRICTENIETPQSRIDFRLIDGDLKLMKGAWTLHTVTNNADDITFRGALASSDSLVMLQQTVRAEAGAGLFEGAFNMVFTNSMKENLNAISQEATQRDRQSQQAGNAVATTSAE